MSIQELRPFKITVKDEVTIVMADSASTAEKYARTIATDEINFSVENLSETGYRETDFNAVNRIEGGKENAPVYPFVIKVKDDETTVLATSLTVATKHALELVKEDAGFSVESLPVSEYSTTDWTAVKELPKAEKSKRGRKPKNTEEVDAANQTEMANIPGME